MQSTGITQGFSTQTNDSTIQRQKATEEQQPEEHVSPDEWTRLTKENNGHSLRNETHAKEAFNSRRTEAARKTRNKAHTHMY